jgi:TRAP-type transport system periplasmic protein
MAPMMTPMRKRPYLVLALLVALAGGAPAVAAETWHMPTPYPFTSFHTRNIEQFALDVKEASGGAVDIKVHAAGSLIKHEDIKKSVRNGQVPLGEFLLSRLSNENPLFEVDSLPFLASNYADSERLWRSSRPYLQELFDAEGLLILFSVPWPPQALYTNRVVTTIGDLRGVRMRAYNRTQERLAQLAGAVPIQIEVPEIPQAFGSGRVQAMITSPSTAATAQAWQFLSHHYDTQAWLPKNVVVVNKKIFMRLDEQARQAILDAAAAAETRGWEMSKIETETATGMLKEHGIAIEAPSAELTAELHRIGAVIAEEWTQSAGRMGHRLIEQYRQEETARR